MVNELDPLVIRIVELVIFASALQVNVDLRLLLRMAEQ